MTSLAETRVLFVATAGRRQASAHFVQYLLVARTLGVRPLVAVPGPRRLAEEAVALGADVIAEATPRVIDAMQPDLVVIEDPIAAQIGGWIIAAQRAGALVVTLHELGISALQRTRPGLDPDAISEETEGVTVGMRSRPGLDSGRRELR